VKNFARFGDTFTIYDNENSPYLEQCDMFVIMGNDVKGRPAKEYVYKSGKPFLVVTGSLFNVKNPTMVRVNVNGFVNNMAQLPDADYNRWEKIRRYYGFKNIFKKKEGKGVVIALNAKTSPAQFDGIEDWLYDTVKTVSESTDQPIYIRHHRKRKVGYSEKYNQLLKEFKVNQDGDTKGGKVPTKYAAAITYTSTFSVTSLMHGTPHIATHPGNFVYGITESDPANLEWYPDEDSLTYHYARLARCEWDIDEIRNGKCWETVEHLLHSNPQQNYNWIGV
jgi:hypothetical protein